MTISNHAHLVNLRNCFHRKAPLCEKECPLQLLRVERANEKKVKAVLVALHPSEERNRSRCYNTLSERGRGRIENKKKGETPESREVPKLKHPRRA
jgi:hypothetical protein